MDLADITVHLDQEVVYDTNAGWIKFFHVTEDCEFMGQGDDREGLVLARKNLNDPEDPEDCMILCNSCRSKIPLETQELHDIRGTLLYYQGTLKDTPDPLVRLHQLMILHGYATTGAPFCDDMSGGDLGRLDIYKTSEAQDIAGQVSAALERLYERHLRLGREDGVRERLISALKDSDEVGPVGPDDEVPYLVVWDGPPPQLGQYLYIGGRSVFHALACDPEDTLQGAVHLVVPRWLASYIVGGGSTNPEVMGYASLQACPVETNDLEGEILETVAGLFAGGQDGPLGDVHNALVAARHLHKQGVH